MIQRYFRLAILLLFISMNLSKLPLKRNLDDTYSTGEGNSSQPLPLTGPKNFFVTVGVDYDENTQRPKSYINMALALYTSHSTLSQSCIGFTDFDTTQNSANITDMEAEANYTNFEVTGKSFTADLSIDRSYWKLNANVVLGSQCLSNDVTFEGSTISGILGMGIASGSSQNYLKDGPLFSIYVKKDSSSGILSFTKDSDKIIGEDPVVTLSSSNDWCIPDVKSVAFTGANGRIFHVFPQTPSDINSLKDNENSNSSGGNSYSGGSSTYSGGNTSSSSGGSSYSGGSSSYPGGSSSYPGGSSSYPGGSSSYPGGSSSYPDGSSSYSGSNSSSSSGSSSYPGGSSSYSGDDSSSSSGGSSYSGDDTSYSGGDSSYSGDDSSSSSGGSSYSGDDTSYSGDDTSYSGDDSSSSSGGSSYSGDDTSYSGDDTSYSGDDSSSSSGGSSYSGDDTSYSGDDTSYSGGDSSYSGGSSDYSNENFSPNNPTGGYNEAYGVDDNFQSLDTNTTNSSSISYSLALDLNSDAIGIPDTLYSDFIAAFEKVASINCTRNIYLPTCTYTGSIDNLPHLGDFSRY